MTSLTLLFSCSDDKESHLATPESLENYGTWNEIGQLHNEGLEDFYDRLVESDIEINESTTDQVFEILDDLIDDYYPTIQEGLNPPHYPISKETHDMILSIHTNEEIKLLDDPNSEFLYTTIEEMGADNELIENVRLLMNIYDNTENWESYELMETA